MKKKRKNKEKAKETHVKAGTHLQTQKFHKNKDTKLVKQQYISKRLVRWN